MLPVTRLKARATLGLIRSRMPPSSSTPAPTSIAPYMSHTKMSMPVKGRPPPADPALGFASFPGAALAFSSSPATRLLSALGAPMRFPLLATLLESSARWPVLRRSSLEGLVDFAVWILLVLAPALPPVVPSVSTVELDCEAV